MIKNKTVRILAIAPLSRGLGYAVMEGPDKLVACGNKAILHDKNARALAWANRFIQFYQPDVLVLPNVGAADTFTLDPKNYANEETAFEDSRDWLRKLFYQLRQGVEHEGKTYVIDAPYCIKVEFHESGWVHFHAIFLTRRFLPKELLAELWDRGWVTVQRITTPDFHYLLKYVTKAADLPEWVRKRKRLRVFQTTKGFLKPLPPKPKTISLKEPRKRASYTMAERFWRWACMAVIRQNGNARIVRFQMPYREIFDQLVLAAALAGRYKGSGEIIINRKEVLNPWIQLQHQLLKAKS